MMADQRNYTENDRTDGVPQAITAEVDDTARTLQSKLATINDSDGLNRKNLLDIHSGIRRLDRRSVAPTSGEFWESTARPMSRRWAAASTEAIDTELAGLLNVIIGDAGSIVGEPDRQIGAPIEKRLLEALPDRSELDALGTLWQKRLRRAAMVAALPAMVQRVADDASLVVSEYEMALLDTPPWSQGDRLLSAYELAHRELVSHGRRSIATSVVKIVTFIDQTTPTERD